MTLYIDIENKKLVQSLTSDRSVGIPIFMQGDCESLEIHLLETGEDSRFIEKPLVVGTDFIRVAIARFSGYRRRKLVALVDCMFVYAYNFRTRIVDLLFELLLASTVDCPLNATCRYAVNPGNSLIANVSAVFAYEPVFNLSERRA